MKTCPFCGSITKDEDIFCNQCGKSLVKTCPNCGEQIEINAMFCRECGFELNKSETEKEETPSAKPSVPIYKKWWFWLVAAAAIVGLILLFASGGGRGDSSAREEPEEIVSENSDHEEISSQKSEATEKEITDEEKVEEITEFQETVDKAIEHAFAKPSETKTSEKKDSMDIEEFQKTMEAVLEESFGANNYETNLDQEDKLYNVYVWIDGGTKALEAAQKGDEEDILYWNARIGLLLETSQKIKEKLDGAGLSDWSVTLSLLDEDTHSEIYAVTKDGAAYYEILEDGKLET